MIAPSLQLPTNPRKTPSLLAIASAWTGREDWPDYPGNIDMGEPFCARCEWRVPDLASDDDKLADVWRFATRWIDRAHLVDHMHDGRDDASNLVPLCHLCHLEMPSFKVGEGDAALAWVKEGRSRTYFTQFTDGYAEHNPDLVRSLSGVAARSWLRNAWLIFLEAKAALADEVLRDGPTHES